jgi:hypothetical protein
MIGMFLVPTFSFVTTGLDPVVHTEPTNSNSSNDTLSQTGNDEREHNDEQERFRPICRSRLARAIIRE